MTAPRPGHIKGHCRVCGKDSILFLLTPQDQAAFDAWLNGGSLAAVAFSHWDDDKIDTLVTGIHPECFDPNADVKEYTDV